MTDAFIAALLTAALQKYLGLGSWVWLFWGVSVVGDTALALFSAATKDGEK